MSQSPLATTGSSRHSHYATESSDSATGAELEEILGAFDDADCRRILNATSDEARSAKELAETCDLALSTTYRKLDRLSDAGLLEEGLRLRRSGNHTSEYAARLDEFTLSVSPGDGVQLRVAERGAADGVGAF